MGTRGGGRQDRGGRARQRELYLSGHVSPPNPGRTVFCGASGVRGEQTRDARVFIGLLCFWRNRLAWPHPAGPAFRARRDQEAALVVTGPPSLRRRLVGPQPVDVHPIVPVFSCPPPAQSRARERTGVSGTGGPRVRWSRRSCSLRPT